MQRHLSLWAGPQKEIEHPCKASFLDLSTEVHDSKFITEPFDKRDVFPFHIIFMPYLDTNIPSKIFYASIVYVMLYGWTQKCSGSLANQLRAVVDAFATALSWFASDTEQFCVHPYNICGEASAHLYGEEHGF